MKITIEVETNEVRVDEIDPTLPDSEAMQKVAYQLRKFANRLDPQETLEMIVNEDRLEDITEEMKIDFLSNHKGSIH